MVPGNLSHIANIRSDYSLAALNETIAGDDPILFFTRWFTEAQASAITEVNAMALATVDAEGKPHARIVLLKGIEDGGFTFFTNYSSAKGSQIAQHAHVALVFFWKELERQVRIEGRASKLATEESDAYFNSRPTGSRLGAWASPQSSIIPGREVLDKYYAEYEQKFAGKEITRPAHWGGYHIMPETIEFWQGRSNRMHDRILFTRETHGGWGKCRLAP